MNRMNVRWAWMLLCLFAPLPVRAEEPKKPTYPPPTEVRTAFKKLLDRPTIPLHVQKDEPTLENGLIWEHISFASEKKADGTIERVPVLVVRPEKSNGDASPAVIVLHGTGGNKEGKRGWLTDLAKRGIIGVAIDARYHGERVGGAQGATAYNEAITSAWKAKPGERRSIRSTTTPAGTSGARRLSPDARRRRPQADRHDRHQHGRHRDLAGGVGRRARRGRGAGHRRAELPLEPGERQVAGPGQHDQGRPRGRGQGPGRGGGQRRRSAASSGTRSFPASSTSSTARACSASSPAGRC